MTHDKVKLTKVRRAMLDVLKGAQLPISAAEIASYMPMKVNKVTIYRDLELFTKSGVVELVQFEESFARYRLKNSCHSHHLICEDCGIIQEVEMPNDLDDHEKRIADQTGFVVLKHSLEFYGLCRDCRH